MTLSEAGLEFIARWEGYRRFPYNDAVGYATIGYGHLLHYSNVTVRDRLRYPAGLSVRQALRLLRKDALAAQRAVHDHAPANLRQHEFDALVSFAFNCGGGALAHSTLLKDVVRYKQPQHHVPAGSIRHDFENYSHAGGRVLAGLLRRRREEAGMFLEGVYPKAGL